MSLYEDAVRHCSVIADQDNRLLFETLLEEEKEHGRSLANWLRQISWSDSIPAATHRLLRLWSVMMVQQWRERTRPVRLEKRYEFPDYAALRDFLDLAADLSEQQGLYPDMGFAKDYVNITIHLNEDEQAISEGQRRFARQLDGLAGKVGG